MRDDVVNISQSCGHGWLVQCQIIKLHSSLYKRFRKKERRGRGKEGRVSESCSLYSSWDGGLGVKQLRRRDNWEENPGPFFGRVGHNYIPSLF